MTWMGEGEEPDNTEISEEDKVIIERISMHLDAMADRLAMEPFDPKVEAHLRMAADSLREQLQLNKFYPWECEEHKEEPNSKEDKPYLFLENKSDKKDDIMTAEELKNWFESSGEANDGDTK